ncbi:MAG: vanadium-dependent haloperoxidase [Vicinamibacterales bacterium]
MTHRVREFVRSVSTRVRTRRALGRAALALSLALAMPAAASAQSLDTLVRWNRVLLTALTVPGGKPPTVFDTRHLAIVSVAVFDAVNSFDRVYQPYATWAEPADGASRDAAVAQAAHDALVALMPTQTATFDAALAESLAGIPPQAAADGAAVGAAAARAILDLRTGDGWEQPFPPLELPSLPGYWKPTPPANAPAAFTNYPRARGFIVEDGRHFMIEGPPPLTSELYARDFNQVKAWGAVNSTVRSAEQTLISNQWAGVGTSTNINVVWNTLIGDIARSRGWSSLELARGFALLNMTFHDALLTSFTGKFVYGLWRPVTAIREADTDGNGATEADPTWLPLLATPPYPSAPGNMACIGSSLARVMERLTGRDDVAFSITWTGTGTNPSATRSYSSFSQLGLQQAYSRIWGGIHFEFETLSSMGQCPRLADYAVDNVLRRR